MEPDNQNKYIVSKFTLALLPGNSAKRAGSTCRRKFNDFKFKERFEIVREEVENECKSIGKKWESKVKIECNSTEEKWELILYRSSGVLAGRFKSYTQVQWAVIKRYDVQKGKKKVFSFLPRTFFCFSGNFNKRKISALDFFLIFQSSLRVRIARASTEIIVRGIGRSFCRSFCRNFGLSFRRSCGRSFGRGFGHSFGRSFGRSFSRSISASRSLGRSICRFSENIILSTYFFPLETQIQGKKKRIRGGKKLSQTHH